jgi:hypothetical protein
MFDFLGVYCLRPGMPPSLPYRNTRALKTRIGERADGHKDQARAHLGFPEHCSPAFRAEAEVDRPAAFGDTCITLDGALGGLDLLSRINRLNTERASGPALTFEAVTHPDPDRLALAHEPELPAAAGRLSNFHAHALLPFPIRRTKSVFRSFPRKRESSLSFLGPGSPLSRGRAD